MNADAIIQELIVQRNILGDRAGLLASALADASAEIARLTKRVAGLEQKPADGAKATR